MLSRIILLLLCILVYAGNSSGAKVKTDTVSNYSSGLFQPIASGYGSDSIKDIRVEYHKPVLFRHQALYMYLPKNVSGQLPTVFFFHGVGNGHNNSYDKLLRHMASRGLCVLHITYRMKSFPYQGKTYRRMFNGCRAAVKYFGEYIDTTKVGFAGHSFGAAAIPYIALRSINERHWGSSAVFMYFMSPHYIFEISQKQLQQFPGSVNMIMQVYADDDCNDHRIAKDLFETIAIPDSSKEFIVLFSDTNATAGCRLLADHSTPASLHYGHETVDNLDFYGIFRYFDALADYTFNGSEQGRELALGHGAPDQRFMGTWPDGTPVREALISPEAPLVKPESFFYFHWKHLWNVRRRSSLIQMPDSAAWNQKRQK